MEDGILKSIFIEELDRSRRILRVYKEELEKLPKGSIVIKNIKGRPYHYLQYRDGNRVKSEYVSELHLEEVQKNLEKRKELKQAIKRATSNINALEKVLK